MQHGGYSTARPTDTGTCGELRVSHASDSRGNRNARWVVGMSEKKRRSVTLSPENDAYLRQQNNASAVIDDLVTQLREGGDKATAVLDMQIQQKRTELTEAENRVERLEQGLDDLIELRNEMQAKDSAELQEARAALSGVPDDPNNPAIKNWASKLGLSPEGLIERL